MKLRKAVLMIHGFAGGVYDAENLSRYLQLNRKLDVFTFTLPGHEKGVKLNNEYKEWVKKSEDELQFLIDNGYNSIYIIGHSMGGVIATYLASKYKNVVKKVILAAPAFKYLYVDDKGLQIVKTIKNSPDILKGYPTTEVVSRFFQLSPTALKEFMRLVKKYYNTPLKIDQPIMIIHGTEDKIVPESSTDYVYNSVKSKCKVYVTVQGANHDLFRSSKKDEINILVCQFLTHHQFKTQKKIEI
jgi:esterase/lipase